MGFTNAIWAVGDLAGMVRDARRHLHLTQADVAKRTGISRPWISQFEKGKITNPSFDRLLKVCDTVDIRLSGTYGPLHDQSTSAKSEHDDKARSAHLNEAIAQQLSSSLPNFASLVPKIADQILSQRSATEQTQQKKVDNS